MSLQKIVDTQIDRKSGTLYGNIASPFYEYAPGGSEYTWACDVDISNNNTDLAQGHVLRNVPIDAVAKNDVLRWGQAGTPVVLSQICKDKYVVVGVSPKKLSNTHVIYVDFTEYIGRVVSSKMLGRNYRALTFAEIGLYGGGWGQCPFGAYGCFDADGNFLELIY